MANKVKEIKKVNRRGVPIQIYVPPELKTEASGLFYYGELTSLLRKAYEDLVKERKAAVNNEAA